MVGMWVLLLLMLPCVRGLRPRLRDRVHDGLI